MASSGGNGGSQSGVADGNRGGAALKSQAGRDPLRGRAAGALGRAVVAVDEKLPIQVRHHYPSLPKNCYDKIPVFGQTQVAAVRLFACKEPCLDENKKFFE
jgi:hypothetical protein